MATQPVSIDISSWSKRNLWRLPSGEVAVRPGLRKIFDTSGGGRLIAGAFTIRNDFSGGEVWHYVVTYSDNTRTTRDPKMFIYDENFALQQSSVPISSNRAPRVVTVAVVQGQVMICSPDFPPMWGLVGSMINAHATKVPSDDTTTTAIDIPVSCICTSWVGSRVVYAAGRSIFVSDPITSTGGSPRTVVAENQCELPGVVYGIHEGAGGMLVAVTNAGVYGLDSAAASVGIIGSGGADWRLLNHHRVSNYGASCVVRGRVFALTQRGYMLVDVEGDDETILNEPLQSLGIAPGRYALEDFRAARLLPGEHGPIVASDDLGAVVMTDMTGDGFTSWWKSSEFNASGTAYGSSSFVGILDDVDGSPLYVGSHGIYRAIGDFDGTQMLSSFSTHHTGSLRGGIPNPPAGSLRPMHVHFAAANGASTGATDPKQYAGYRGKVYSGVPSADDIGITIGVDSWGTTSKRYTVTPLESTRASVADNKSTSNEMTFEVGADGGLVRVTSTINVDYSESATNRPSTLL